MSGFDRLLLVLPGMSVWLVAKGLMVIALILYLVFAVVVIRQVQLMSRTLNGALELPLKLLSYIHLGLAVLVMLMAVVLL